MIRFDETMNRLKRNGGFTLIELIVVAVILTILAPIANYLKQDSSNQSRAIYAVQQTAPLRQKMAGFYGQYQRWPTASELGVAQSLPYPDGGFYSLQAEGGIVITFAVVPELKGKHIYIQPAVSADGKTINWTCSADPEIPSHYYTGCF